MKNLLLLLFIARVAIPMGMKVTIENIETVWPEGMYYRLDLVGGKKVFVPTMFTVIEEVK